MIIYGEDLKRLIYTYVHDWNETEDLLQEVFLKIYKNLDQFNKNSSLKTWIFRITVNTCKDYLKFRLRQKEKIKRFFNNHNSIPSFNEDPESLMIEKDFSSQILTTIFSLSQKYQEIIILFYYYDLSTKEISETLSINESTVRTRLARAREKLKKSLGGVVDEK